MYFGNTHYTFHITLYDLGNPTNALCNQVNTFLTHQSENFTFFINAYYLFFHLYGHKSSHETNDDDQK